MFIVGIDIAKRYHEASVIAKDGSPVRKAMRFANSQEGYNKLMDMVRSLNEPVVFGMEATGHYWLTLYTHLRNDGFTVHVINPIQSDALRGMYIRKTKNDFIDSMIIADVIRFGRHCETSVEPGDLRAMRELCRQQFYVIDMASDLKRKAIALLGQVFPEYEKLFSDTFGASSMKSLSQYTTPEELLSADSGKLAELLETASYGRLGLTKAEEIQAAAKNSFGIVLASNSFALIIRQYIEQIRSFEASIAVFDTEIARLLAGFNTQLTTITGIEPTLAVILSEIGGDIKRFSSPTKPATYAGIDPTMKQSGNFAGTRMTMSKRGSPLPTSCHLACFYRRCLQKPCHSRSLRAQTRRRQGSRPRLP